MELTPLNIINIIIGSFTIFLAFIYINSNSLKSIPCYFNLGFCFIIIINNFIRLYHPKETDMEQLSILCKIQGFALSFLDKLFLTSITIYSVIICLNMINPDYFKVNMKFIYYISTIINVIISLGLTIIYFLLGMSDSILRGGHFCYIDTYNDIKKISDATYTGILLFIDLICVFKTLCLICSSMKNCDVRNKTKRRGLCQHFVRFIFALLLNILTFGFLFAIVLKLFNEYVPSLRDHKDIIFVIICFVDELFFTINSQFLRETMRILTCNKVERFRQQRPYEDMILNRSNSESFSDSYYEV